MAWNLADQFNSDLDEKGLFDNLPAQVSQLRSDEVLKADVRKLNKTTEGSVVPDSKIAPLEDPKTRSELDSTSRQLKAEQSGNVFDNFEPPKKQTPAPQEQQEPPKELTLGEIIAEGYGIIGQVKALKNLRTGAKREVTREREIDEQFIGMVRSRMGDLFEERNLDRNLVERLATRPGGGYRTAEEIDRVDRIRREGAVINVDGQEITLPKDLDWDQAFDADNRIWAQSFKAAKTKENDSVKQTQEFFNLAKSWQEAKSKSQENPEDKESQIVFKMLSNRLKTIGGEEYKQLEFGYNQEQYANMMQYYGQKVRPDGQPTEGLKDKTADQVRLESIKSGAIPVVEGVAGDNGISYDTDDLASKFPGGKLVEGAFVALRNPNAKSADQEFQTHRILNGRLAKLSGPSEKPTESKDAPKAETSKVPVPVSAEEIQANLTAASSTKEKLDKMWSGGFAVSPDKAKRAEYAATKKELNENLAPVYAQIRKLEQEVKDSMFPNFKGDASLNEERFRQIKELRKQIPLGHRLGKELLPNI